MGWAKYYEDNLSILNAKMDYDYKPNDQWEFLNCSRDVVVSKAERPKAIVRQAYIFQGTNRKNLEQCSKKVATGTNRNGLELTIIGKSDVYTDRKLQINGWWKSKSKGCWCNSNTSVNRTFADNFVRSGVMTLKIIA